MDLSDSKQQLKSKSLGSRIYIPLSGFFVPLVCLVLLFGTQSCNKPKVARVDLGYDMDSAYMMLTTEVDMLVSDSGQTKYRVISPRWIIYDREDKKQWLFDQGLKMLGVDSLQPQSELVLADTAIFHVEQDAWELIGHVQVHGMRGERLYTPRLHWERAQRRLYSNDTTYFATEGKELRGDRFEAKDDLSWFSIYNNSGDFLVQDKELESKTDTLKKD